MSETTIIQTYVDRFNAGDPTARDQLIEVSVQRLTALIRQMKKDFPNVGRWEETDDIFQAAMVRLCRALEEVAPNDARHFLRLAALQIRRQLLDLARKLGGKYGVSTNHESVYDRIDGTNDPLGNLGWNGADVSRFS